MVLDSIVLQQPIQVIGQVVCLPRNNMAGDGRMDQRPVQHAVLSYGCMTCFTHYLCSNHMWVANGRR